MRGRGYQENLLMKFVGALREAPSPDFIEEIGKKRERGGGRFTKRPYKTCRTSRIGKYWREP